MSIPKACCVALVALTSACGPAGPGVGGARSFAEIDVPAATRAVAEDDARLVQVRGADSLDPHIGAAVIVAPDGPVPDAWRNESRPIVLVASDVSAARRVAARLVRLGIGRVSVVRGGIGSWVEPREEPGGPASRVGLSEPRGAKPSEPEHPRRMHSWQQSQK